MSELADDSLAIIFLAGVSLIWALWLCLPGVLQVLGLVGYRSHVLGGPESVSLSGNPELPQDLRCQLHDLGFSPLGVYWESDDLRGGFKEHVFVSREHGCFASVYHLFRDGPSITFQTLCADGAQVHTKNFDCGVEVDGETLLATGESSDDLTRVFQLHRNQIRKMSQMGHPPEDRSTMEDYVAAAAAYYYSPYIYPTLCWGRTLMGLGRVAFLGFLFAVPILFMDRGIHQPEPWIGLLAGSLSCSLVRAPRPGTLARPEYAR